MTTDDREESMNSVEDNDDAIKEAVRDTLDEIADEVEREVNRIATLRSLAQQIIDEMIRKAANRSRDPGSGDIRQRRSWNPYDNIQQNTTYRQNTENAQGLMKRHMDDHEAIDSIKQAINISRSLTSLFKQSPSHLDYNTELDSLRRAYSMPSDIQVRSLHTSKENITSEDGQLGKSDATQSVKKDEPAQKEAKTYPRYDIVNTLNTPYGEITVYANGELDDAERIRILHESVNILKEREQADRENKDNAKKDKKCDKEGNGDKGSKGDKKSGFASRVKKFFGRMCCCCCYSSD
ncbi:hypothetical protein ACF0H5_017421 [Mactra antiquata]